VEDVVTYLLAAALVTLVPIGDSAADRSNDFDFSLGTWRTHISRLVHPLGYAHALPSGMASVAERVTARALGKRTKLKIIEGKKRDVRRSLDDTSKKAEKKVASS
jgi:hypothetical protein